MALKMGIKKVINRYYFKKNSTLAAATDKSQFLVFLRPLENPH